MEGDKKVEVIVNSEKMNINAVSKNEIKIVNVDEIEGSTFKTKKKSFISEINPHLAKRNIQKEQYIWFGVYDQLLRNKILISYLKKCRDSALPLECAAIHMEKFQVSFCKAKEEVKAYLFESEGSVVFLKLYLITKEQLVDILKHYYGVTTIGEDVFVDINKAESQKNLDENSDYSLIKCMGELDGIFIYSMTCNKPLSQMQISAPDTDYLRNIYLGLKKSFSPYSEYLIMYYVYRLEGVRNFYTMNQLKDCFFKNKNTTDTSLESKEVNNLDNNNLNNNSPTKQKDNETVKCSTCNASPFVTTPEKDHLNQYSYIFDLHHLPIFDENTGEFFWSNNEANWKKARDSILKSEEIGIYNGKSMSINHGSLMSLSGSFLIGGNTNVNLNTNLNTTNNNNEIQKTDEDFNLNQWTKFKNDGDSNTFVEELNNLLKDFEK